MGSSQPSAGFWRFLRATLQPFGLKEDAMALVQCKECGGKVSTTAKACPSCGAAVSSQPKTKKVHIVLVGALAATVALAYISSGPSSSSSPDAMEESSVKRPESSELKIMAAQIHIKKSLKDPDSAKFGKVFYRNNSVCGLVNSRNSFGGYSGDKAYVVDFSQNTSMIDDGSSEFKRLWRVKCG